MVYEETYRYRQGLGLSQDFSENHVSLLSPLTHGEGGLQRVKGGT